jgi:hypothetical protein
MKPVGELLSHLIRNETGAVESAQIFAWIVVTVIAIMALGALMQSLGVDVIDWVRTQIGI